MVYMYWSFPFSDFSWVYWKYNNIVLETVFLAREKMIIETAHLGAYGPLIFKNYYYCVYYNFLILQI